MEERKKKSWYNGNGMKQPIISRKQLVSIADSQLNSEAKKLTPSGQLTHTVANHGMLFGFPVF
jgi:hypothetical protein